MSVSTAPKTKRSFKLTKKWIILIVIVACFVAFLGTCSAIKSASKNEGIKVFESYISAAKSQSASKMAGTFHKKGSDEYNRLVSNINNGKSGYKNYIKDISEGELAVYLEDPENLPESSDNQDELKDYGLKMYWEQVLAKNIKSFSYTVLTSSSDWMELSISIIHKKRITSSDLPLKYESGLIDKSVPDSIAVTFKKVGKKWYFASDFRLMYGSDVIHTTTLPAGKDRLELKKVNTSDNLYSEDGLPVFYTAQNGQKVYDINRLSTGIVSIGRTAFLDCKDINIIILPDDLTNISPYAFKGCTALTKVIYADDTSITAESDITVGDGIFYGCSALTSFELPAKNKIIPNYMLMGCSSLTSFTIPATTTAIGYYAFYGCSKITAFDIPESVSVIGDGAFENCLAMTTVVKGATPAQNNILSENITRMGANVFKNCIVLSSVTLPDTITEIDLGMFDNCEKLNKIVFPKDLKSIGNYAFRKTAFTGINIPSSVSKIGDEAFANSLIKNFSFTNDDTEPTIRTIGQKAFYECKNLSFMHLPVSIKGIGDQAFNRCTDMRAVKVDFSKSAVVGENIFSSSYGIPKIYLKNDAVSHFRTAWYSMGVSMYSQDIIEGDFAFVEETRLNADGNPIREKVLIQYLGFDDSDGVITLDKKITRIGDGAFSFARDLRGIENFDELENLNAIGSDAFTNSGIEYKIYGNSTTVGQLYYLGGWVIKSETIDDTLDFTNPTKYALNGTSTTDFLPTTVGIAADVFAKAGSIEKIFFASDLKYIGNSAFSSVTSLRYIEFEDGSLLKSIGENAFYSCSALDHIILSEDLTEIGNKAFDFCTDLRYVEIHSTENLLIGTDVFRITDNVLKLYIDGYDENTYYSANTLWKAFAGNIFDTKIIEGDFAILGDTIIQYLWTDYNIENSEKGNYSQKYNVELLDRDIKIIGQGAFAKTVISAIAIHSQLLSIEQYAFYDCQSLVEVEFLATSVDTDHFMHDLIYIGTHAFGDCDSLSLEDSRVYFRATGPNANFSTGLDPFDTSIYRNIDVPNRENYVNHHSGYWSKNSYMLAAHNDPKATITIEIKNHLEDVDHKNDVNIITDIPIQRNPGESEKLIAIPNETNGYVFDGWYNVTTGQKISAAGSKEATIYFGDTGTSSFYKAVFVKEKANATIINTIGGTIGNSFLSKIDEAFTVTAAVGIEYEFAGWYVDGVYQAGNVVDGVHTLTWIMDYYGVTIKAEYEQVKEWIEISDQVGGSVNIDDEAGFGVGEIVKEANKTKVLLGKGDSVKITATADQNYVFVGWAINGDDINLITTPEYICTMYSDRLETITIRPVFEKIKIAITVNYDDTKGEVTYTRESGSTAEFVSGDTIEFSHGFYLILKATPEEGYVFLGWRIVGETYDQDEYLSKSTSLYITVNSTVVYEAIFAAEQP